VLVREVKTNWRFGPARPRDIHEERGRRPLAGSGRNVLQIPAFTLPPEPTWTPEPPRPLALSSEATRGAPDQGSNVKKRIS